MPKFKIHASGNVKSRRHRNMTVYADNESAALEKAQDIFVKAIKKSKIDIDSIEDVTVEINKNAN